MTPLVNRYGQVVDRMTLMVCLLEANGSNSFMHVDDR